MSPSPTDVLAGCERLRGSCSRCRRQDSGCASLPRMLSPLYAPVTQTVGGLREGDAEPSAQGLLSPPLAPVKTQSRHFLNSTDPGPSLLCCIGSLSQSSVRKQIRCRKGPDAPETMICVFVTSFSSSERLQEWSVLSQSLGLHGCSRNIFSTTP